MKATELRIGNWVQDKHSEECGMIDVVVLGIIYDYPVNHLHPENHSYKPIPLTEEWLKRFGCELIVFDITKGDIGFDFWLTPKGSDYSVSVNLEHVHQLQNLYFALTQEEIKCS